MCCTLAVGTYEGQVVLWDFDTRGVARTLSRHTKQVTGLSWSRNGRYLASGSADQSLILWDVLNGTQALEVQLPVPITHVSLSARPPYKCVVSFAGGHPPVITDLESSQEQVLPVLADTEATKQGKPGESSSSAIVAMFSKDSSTVFVGQTRGLISVVEASSLRFLDIVKASNMARYLGLSLNPKGTLLLANCHDRVLRLFEVHSPPQAHHSLSLEEANQALENVNIKGASGHHENMVAQEQAAAAAREGKTSSGPLVEEIDVEVEPEEGAGAPADGDGTAAGPGPGTEGVPLGGVARVDGEGDEVMDGGGAAEVAEAEALDLQAAMLASRAHALELGGGAAGDDADMPMQPQGSGAVEEGHQAKKRREMEGTL
ncbi:WD40-repeat-containing domain protein [Dunaliella salina]|uniref:WD40-repeat-containing domain protein n=1 Tax=Dunaliella salina TaxID=3046 RepID=A0ABQ7H3W1_DUNSA|nr:WD40-repeat-containing domain protein [Dunaliella salina]|eukprot:KAF5841501.1 WD40-repeat-containing domain protein [Dunaliella salina]